MLAGSIGSAESNTSSMSDTVTASTNRVSVKQCNTFPFRLHEMLDSVEKEGMDHIVSWIPGNPTAFKVHKPQEFVKIIMPRFFQQTKYKSFQRQCNLWSFERILNGPEKGGYEHPEGYFLRGNPSLVTKMIRRKIKRGSSLDTIGTSGKDMDITQAPTIIPAAGVGGSLERRPSIVSCSSHQSGRVLSGNTTGHENIVIVGNPQPPQDYYTTMVPPASPLGTSYYSSSVETTPSSMPRKCLYPSHPSSFESEDLTSNDAATAACDTLFLEGLSVFFEDEGTSNVSDSAMPPPTSAIHIGETPLPLNNQQNTCHPPQQLQPKRRLSMDLFVASRQQNSNEIILDLLTGSDTLQKSLEMELMCPLSQV